MTITGSTILSSAVVLLCAVPSIAGAQGGPAPEALAVTPRGLVVREEGTFDGYTLISPLLSKTTFLLDMDGQVVHRWDTQYPPGNLAHLLPNGNLLRPARWEQNPVFWGGGIGGRIQELDWDGKVVWDYVLSDEERCLHHDVEPLPNGNVLCIIWERMSREDAILFGRDADATGNGGIWPDAVLELEPIKPDGARIVWEWHVMDHLIQDTDPEKPNYGNVAEHPERIDINVDHRERAAPSAEELERVAKEEEQMRALGYVGGAAAAATAPAGGATGEEMRSDWLHTNAVSLNTELDLIVLSTPRLDEIWVIDHSTTSEEAAGSSGGRHGRGGDLLWRWGNPKNYGAGSGEDRRLFGQHDSRWIRGPKGEAHLLVFNNGGGRPQGDFSSVDELAFPIDASGKIAEAGASGFPPAKLSWTYRASEPKDFFSGFISGADRLPNGNTLVCSGAPGEVFEVTPVGKIVWKFLNPHGGDVPASFGNAAGPQGPNASTVPPHALFRAARIPPDHPGLARLTDSAPAK